jgi:hypothetical protein
MKVSIEGREYDLTEAIHKPKIGDVLDLKRSGGTAPARIVDAIDELGEALRALPEDATMRDLDRVVLEFFDSVEHLEAFAGIVFLCRRKAGEPATWADALGTSISDVQFALGPDDEGDDEGEGDDPKAQSTPEADGTDAEEG